MTDGTPHRVVTLAGHVDHGKSSLLRALTGMEPDRLEEERRRGRTIELGFVWTTLDGPAGGEPVTVAFVDVPGHARLVGTMIAGSGVSPAALLVVAADDGPAVQTREHLDVLDLLGVPGLAIAVTKADRVTAERLAAAEDEVRAAVGGTQFADAPLVPIAGPDPTGLARLREVLAARLAATPRPAADGAARLWVDRAFAVEGVGTVVTGTLADGPLAVGDEVTVLPAGRPARVRRLQQLGRDAEVVVSGTRVAVNLAGVAPGDVRRGDVVVAGPDRSATAVDVVVRVLPGRRLGSRGAHRLHLGTAVRTPRLVPLDGDVADGGVGPVRLLLDRPLPVRLGDRVVIRDAGRGGTVAGGVVVDPEPPRGRSDRAGRHRLLAALAATDPTRGPTAGAGSVGGVAAWVELGGGIRAAAAATAWTGRPGDAVPDGFVVRGDLVVAADRDAAWRDLLVTAAAAGERRGAAVARLAAAGATPVAAAAVLDAAVAAGAVDLVGEVLAPGGGGDAATTARRARADALVARLLEEPFAPPDLVPTAEALGVDHAERRTLTDAGRIVRCGDVAFAGEAVERAVAILAGLQAGTGSFTASEARAALGTTRRYAIPLLEHLVRTGRSRFDGSRHRLTPPA